MKNSCVVLALNFVFLIAGSASFAITDDPLICANVLTAEPTGVETSRAEEAAIESMQQVMITGEQAQKEIRGWFEGIRSHQRAGGKLTVMEHTALLHILRSHFLDEDPDPTIIPEMRTALQESWFHLTSHWEPVEQILKSRLPRQILAQESHDAQVFHAAVFQTRDVNAPISEIAADYIPRIQDKIFGLGLLAVGFSNTGGKMIGAAVMGYLAGAVSEYLIHRFLAHPTGKMREKFKKGGWLAQVFYKIAYSHSNIHHNMTFRPDYTQQFANADDQARVDARLDRDAIDAQAVRDRDYGMFIEPKAAGQMLMTVLPVTAVLSYLFHFTPEMTAAAMATSSLFIGHVNMVHNLMHSTRIKAESESGPVMRWFLKTRYFAMIARNHYVHHRAPYTNYNVLPGVDALFGTWRKPTVEDVLRMRELGAIY